MRRSSLLLTAPRTLAWVDEPLPPPHAHEIIVQTRTGAISIGTELPLYCGTHRGTEPAHYPKMTGYESVATVVGVGSAVQRVAVGDRVIAFYGHRTHVVLKEHAAIVVPPHISDAHALLVILACDAATGVAKTQAQRHEPVLITGAGAIGLLTLFNLKARGIQHVDLIEPNERRRALAARLGARQVVDPAHAATFAHEYRVGFECSSRNEACVLLQQRLAPGGRICVLADGNVEPLVLAPAFHEKELQIVGSSDGNDYHEYARWFFAQAETEWMQLDQLFEQQIPAQDLALMFERLDRSPDRPVKVLVRYDHTSMPVRR